MKRLISIAVASALCYSASAHPLASTHQAVSRQVQNELPNAVPVLVAGDVAPNGVEFESSLEPLAGSDDLSEGVIRHRDNFMSLSARTILDDDDGDDDDEGIRDITNLQGPQVYAPETSGLDEDIRQRSLPTRSLLGYADAEAGISSVVVPSQAPVIERAAQGQGQAPADAPRDPAPVDPPPTNGLPAEPEELRDPEEEPPEPDTSDEESESLQQEQQQPESRPQEPQAQQQQLWRRNAHDPDDEEEPTPLPI